MLVRGAAIATAALAFVPVAAAGPFVQRAGDAVRDGERRVYVDPGAQPTLGDEAIARVEGVAREAGSPPVIVAVLPAVATEVEGGGGAHIAEALGERLDCRCTIGVVVGGELHAASSVIAPEGRAEELARETQAEEADEGLERVLTQFIRFADDEASGADTGWAGTVIGIVVTVAIAAALLWLVLRRRRAWEQLAQVRGEVEREVQELGARAAASGDPAAAEAHRRAERALADARAPRDLARVRAQLARGRRTAPRG
jgi:hypothetical protein